MEIKVKQNLMGNKISRLTAKITHKLRPALCLINIYGRIIFKQKKDCASYYRLGLGDQLVLIV